MKTIPTLICLGFLLSIIGFSQETESKRKWSIGATYSGNSTYRALSPSGSGDDHVDRIIENREDIESPTYGFNAGINGAYEILPNLEVELGVQYARYGFQHKDLDLVFYSGENIEEATIHTKTHDDYLEIPLRVRYRIGNKKLFGFASFGGLYSYYLTSRTKVIDPPPIEGVPKNSEYEHMDANYSRFGITGSIGVGYRIFERFDVRLEPIYRHLLTPIADAPIDQKSYSIGCQAGVYFHL